MKESVYKMCKFFFFGLEEGNWENLRGKGICYYEFV